MHHAMVADFSLSNIDTYLAFAVSKTSLRIHFRRPAERAVGLLLTRLAPVSAAPNGGALCPIRFRLEEVSITEYCIVDADNFQFSHGRRYRLIVHRQPTLGMFRVRRGRPRPTASK
jgi:hypothetical protein